MNAKSKVDIRLFNHSFHILKKRRFINNIKRKRGISQLRKNIILSLAIINNIILFPGSRKKRRRRMT